jgi:hypothetical protein
VRSGTTRPSSISTGASISASIRFGWPSKTIRSARVTSKTLPRKGYRFIAPIAESAPEPGVIAKPRLARLWWLAAALLAVLLAIGVAAQMRALRQPGPKPIESLAVLPLENLSHDPDQDYFAAGMTDELITDLAKIGALRVISRTSVMPYRGTKKPLPQIARELNVDAVLEGTVTRDRGKVRITSPTDRRGAGKASLGREL